MRFPLSPAVFPADVLPAGNVSFNSMSIEAYLYNIPGLAERFVYFNNDMMLNAPVEPSTFFAPHPVSGIVGPRMYVEGVDWRRDPVPGELNVADKKALGKYDGLASQSGLDGYTTGLYNMHYLLDAMFGYEPRPQVLHQGVPSTVSAYRRAFELFPEALTRTGKTLFRSEDNVIPHHLALWTAIYEQKAVRLDPSDDPRSYFLAFTQDTQTNVPIFSLGLNSNPYDLLCINDGTNFDHLSHASINKVVAQVEGFFEAINAQQIARFGYGPRVLPPNATLS